MKITKVEIKNYRAHKKTTIDLVQLTCLIGENNSGKSSILNAIRFGLESTKLAEEDFNDKEQPIEIRLHFTDITEDDLQRVDERHRDRVREMISDGKLTVIRTQRPNESPESGYLKLQPSDEKLNWALLAEKLKGLKGSELRDKAIAESPKLKPYLIQNTATQKNIKDALEQLILELPDEELRPVEAPFPTGISNAVTPLLPKVIYIESVKDVSAETKTSGSSTFNKLLQLLLGEINDQLNDIEESFSIISKQLNRATADDGSDADDRLEAVKLVESTIEKITQESFPGVSVRMNVPAPTLSMLFANAQLLINDGHESPVFFKGDGLKRTVLFALLRAYAELQQSKLKTAESINHDHPYILLFEEPELFLHPNAQQQLMSVLEQFSERHQVLATTHSASFFTRTSEGFIKLSRDGNNVITYSVNVKNLAIKDAYQIMCYENNTAAFFARQVVLVEGDSDTFVYPHLAKLLNHHWDNIDKGIAFVKVNGKRNIEKFKKFFSKFDVPVHAILDLDTLRDGDYKDDELLDLVTKEHELRVEKEDNKSDSLCPSCGKKKEEAKENKEKAERILTTLKTTPTESILKAKNNAIEKQKEEKIYILSRGALEDYCGTQEVAKSQKLQHAIGFCDETNSIEKLKEKLGSAADEIITELENIFKSIYENKRLR